MTTTALIERGKDGTFGVFTPDINSTIIGSGNSVKEAIADFENSVKEIVKFYKEDGLELPAELIDIKFDYKYDIASIFDYFDVLNTTKFAKKAGINASLMRQYKTRKTYISRRQVGKIQNTLHSLGRELTAVAL